VQVLSYSRQLFGQLGEPPSRLVRVVISAVDGSIGPSKWALWEIARRSLAAASAASPASARSSSPLLVLAYLRKGETFADLAAGFGVGTATAWEICQRDDRARLDRGSSDPRNQRTKGSVLRHCG